MLDHFQEIYISSNPQGIDDYIRHIPRCMDDETNIDLCRLVIEKEIKKVVFSFRALKALEGAGLNGIFFPETLGKGGEKLFVRLSKLFLNKEISQRR